MASLGHVALGVLAGRIHGGTTKPRLLASMAVFGTLSLLPDFDVFPLAFGVVDDGLTGHRGVTHTILFALAGAVVTLALARKCRLRPAPTALLVFLTLASHALLDAATNDSRGVPLLWPFSSDRIEGALRPVPVAPTGLAFLSGRGIEVAAVELIAFLPPVLLALWPPTTLRRAWQMSPLVAAAAFIVAMAMSLVSAQLLLEHSEIAARVWRPQQLATRE